MAIEHHSSFLTGSFRAIPHSQTTEKHITGIPVLGVHARRVEDCKKKYSINNPQHYLNVLSDKKNKNSLKVYNYLFLC